MQDVARDGRFCCTVIPGSASNIYRPSGGAQRDLAWLDSSLMYTFRRMRNSLSSSSFPAARGALGNLLRKTDGSLAIQLGSGTRPSLSPDGKWVACIHHGAGDPLCCCCRPAPENRDSQKSKECTSTGVEWFPDNKRILFTGNETDTRPHLDVRPGNKSGNAADT